MRNFTVLLAAIFFVSSALKGQIRIECNTPTVWTAGELNKVEIKINFDSAEGFVRFSQDIPEGIGIIQDDVPSGDFSWYNNRLNVVWLTLPANKQIIFSYFAKPGKSMNGTFNLEGRVVHITGGKTRRVFKMNSVSVTIAH